MFLRNFGPLRDGYLYGRISRIPSGLALPMVTRIYTSKDR